MSVTIYIYNIQSNIRRAVIKTKAPKGHKNYSDILIPDICVQHTYSEFINSNF